MAPNGHPSDFTNYGDSVTIFAPSDNSIRSYDFENNPKNFSGTSGATPLVTGTLGGFSLLSGYAPQTHEAKILLEKTSIPLPYLPSSHFLGAGMLNSYKMGMVALKMKEQCQNYDSTDQRNECMSRLLREEETYNFESESKKMFDEAIKFFPNCLRENNNQEDIQEKNNCKKKEALNNLRRSALLNSSDPKMWQALACVTENVSKKTADFYSSLIERETVGNLCKNNIQLLKYFSKSSFMNLMETEECNFNNKVDQDDLDAQSLAEIAIVVLSKLDETPNAHKILEKIFNHNEFNNINTDNMSIIVSSIYNIFDKLSEKNSQIFLEKIIDQPNNSKISLSNIIYTFRANLDQITHPHILFEKAIDKENLSTTAQSTLVEIVNSNTFYTMENSDELLARFIDKIDSSSALDNIVQSLETRLEQGTKVEKLLIKIAENNHHDDRSIDRLIKLVDDNFDKISNVHKILEKIIDNIDQLNNSQVSLIDIIYTFKNNLDQITPPHILFEKAIDKENLSGYAQLLLADIAASSNTFYTMENSDELLARFIDKIDDSFALYTIVQSLGRRLEQGTKVEKLLIKIAEHNHHDDLSMSTLIRAVDENFDKISNVHKILEKIIDNQEAHIARRGKNRLRNIQFRHSSTIPDSLLQRLEEIIFQ